MASQKQQNSGLTALDKLWLGLYGLVVLLGIIGLLYVSHDTGLKGVLYIVVLVFITDTCGYFVGKLVGGRKFWPSIRPNKTWSGVLGGWFGSAVFSLIWLQTVPQIPAKPHGAGGVSTAWLEADNASTGIYMIIGFVIGAVLLSFASQMGDIAQSSVKRRMGVKDSSNLIPGHGGILDRFDALLAVGALSLIFNVLF
jgi:phosphatidate cytidylyltransferase